MLDDIKHELCFVFNELTQEIGTREISRDAGISLSTVSRIKNYDIDNLKAENIIRSILVYRPIHLDISVCSE